MIHTNCWNKFSNFKSTEFICPCCNQGEEVIDCALLFILQAIRDKYRCPVNVISGFRCQTYNDSLTGSIPNSDHCRGKAADIQVKGHTSISDKRAIIEYASTLPNFKYGYYNGGLYKNGKWISYNAKNMGKSLHISVE